MCGITGAVWTAGGKPLSAAELDRMVAAIAHRGPDDAGTLTVEREESRAERFPHSTSSQLSTLNSQPNSPGVAFGFRRLSIIDLAGGHQPMSDATGRFHIVFNGEIYNYRELRDELRSRGHAFRTTSDTEVLLECYKAWGVDCVTRLRGMFAFAVWDGERLFLARDRFGQKPLCYREEPGRLLFASELKSLMQVDGAPREIDPTAVDDFLTYYYVPAPKSIFLGYAKLLPGHYAVYERGRLTISRYWSPVGGQAPEIGGRTSVVDDPFSDLRPPTSDFCPRTIDPAAAARWSVDDWKRELRRRMTDAVRLRLRSDVPLGAFLSGGVDSTIIVGLMQEILAEQGGRPAMTFSIGFPIAEYDERKYAQEAARHLKTDHHDLVVGPDAAAIFRRLVWQYDEPFADSSALPTSILSEFTRRNVTVALTGDGGDELFCGYDRYQAVRLAQRIRRLPQPVRRMLAAKIWQRVPTSKRQRSFGRRLKRFLAALGESQERQYLRWIGVFDDERRRSLYTPEFARQVGGYDSFNSIERAYTACPDRDFLTRTTCVDMLTYLPNDILTKVDVASMAVGLEARSPFLDHHVAELAALMPIELKLSPAGGKRILIETFSDLLPASIQTRPKMGFGIPLGPWFRGELSSLMRDTLLDSRTAARGWFRREELETYVREHESGRFDHGYRIWTLLTLELWLREWVDSETPPITPSGPASFIP